PNFFPRLGEAPPLSDVSTGELYGRCGVNQCVTMYGSCGQCRDRCSYTSGVYSYYSSYFSGRYYYQCSRGSMYYRSCGLNQSYYPGLGRCGCRESYCERYSGWQATVCNGCGGYVFCRYGRPIRYRRCPGTDATTTVTAIVVSAGATAAVAGAKLTKRR
ncbi:hypothetical protein NP493_6951g00000, partial [Ridgeia piscesae]